MSFPLFASAETWHEDFTDGSFADNSAFGIQFLLNHELRDDGIVISTPTSDNPAAAIAVGLSKSENWSIRTEGRLLQDHGFFGAAIAPTSTSGAGALWSNITSEEYVNVGSFAPGNTTSDRNGLASLDPFAEDVVIQLDVFDGTAQLWAWSAANPPTSEIAPLLEADYIVPNGYAALWVRSDNGPSSAILEYMTVSTEHIAIPEPSTAVHAIAGLVFGIGTLRKRSPHRANSCEIAALGLATLALSCWRRESRRQVF